MPGQSSRQYPVLRKPADVDLGKVKTGKKVLVAGAGLTGCETALHVARKGASVILVDMIKESEIAADVPLTNKFALMELLHQHGVKIMAEVKLHEINNQGAILLDKKKKRLPVIADTIVLALGVAPRAGIIEQFKGLALESYVIGDCCKPRNLMGAIHDGFNIAVEI